VRARVALALLFACSHGGRPSDADCDRATANAARLMDSGFAEQQHTVAVELAKLCKDSKQGWTQTQVECVLAAKTSAAYKQCAD
jgi:hypothetical protein